jgi:uncharacterized protein (TIGR02996 family)
VNDEADAFLDAIRASPDEDEPRERYASWLVEQGDPLGELIRAQLIMARTPYTTLAHKEAARRADAIRRKHRRLDDVRSHDGSTNLARVRGFVGAPLFTTPDLESLDPSAFREMVVENLWVNGAMTEKAARVLVAGLRWMALRTLGASRWPSDDALALVFSSPHLTRLRKAIVSPTSLDVCAQVLADGAPNLAALDVLELYGPRPGAGIARLLDGIAPTALTLGADALDFDAVDGLVRGRHAHRLRALVLNGLDEAAIGALADASSLASLEWLDVSHTPIALDALRMLAASPHLPRSLRLRVHGESLGLSITDSYDGASVVERGWSGGVPGFLVDRFRISVRPCGHTEWPVGGALAWLDDAHRRMFDR